MNREAYRTANGEHAALPRALVLALCMSDKLAGIALDVA
jgi:hypothetical protein